MRRAGHLRHFLIFSMMKNDNFEFFIKLTTISAPGLFTMPTPSRNNLIKNAKNHFLLVKIFKNTSSAQPCACAYTTNVCACVPGVMMKTKSARGEKKIVELSKHFGVLFFFTSYWIGTFPRGQS